jgi:hypothetical protein
VARGNHQVEMGKNSTNGWVGRRPCGHARQRSGKTLTDHRADNWGWVRTGRWVIPQERFHQWLNALTSEDSDSAVAATHDFATTVGAPPTASLAAVATSVVLLGATGAATLAVASGRNSM